MDADFRPGSLFQRSSGEASGDGAIRPNASDVLQAAKVPVTPLVKHDLTSQRDFLWKVHSYTNDYIRFADTKAAFCASFASALIGALFASKLHELFITKLRAGNFAGLTFLADLSLGAFVLLTLSVIFAVVVIRPRLWTHSDKGFIFWEAISAFDAAEAFSTQFRTKVEAELDECLSHHLYTLAKISSRKYFWVSTSILMAAAGAALAVIVLMFKSG
jgi:hypothetical protein